MKVRHIIIVAIFVSVNVLVFYSLDFGGGPKDEDEAKPAFYPTLTASTVKNTEQSFKIEGYGTVSSFNAIDISCEVQGRLTQGKHNLKPGTNVRKGDLLFKINDADMQYTLRARKSGFINIIATLLPDLKIDFPNEFEKWQSYIGSIKLNKSLPSLPAWRTEKEKIFLSTRNVLPEYFAIKSLEEQISKYNVYAPFSGTITEVYSTNLAVVNPGSRILRLVETNNFEIPVSINAEQAKNIQIGTNVNVYNTIDELKGSGVVVRVSGVINKSTQSVDVYVRPKSIDGKSFNEGEYVRVEISKEEKHTGVRIPANAISDNLVYVYSKKDSVLKERAVQIFDNNRSGLFVKGLKNNEIVITQEVLNYTDTSKYKVLIK